MQAIAALWEKAFNGGDIPGAYWAVLTHADFATRWCRRRSATFTCCRI